MTKLNNTTFNIPTARVPSLLTELTEAYPEVTGFDFESPSSNAQYLLWLIGWHTRVRTDGSLFTLSRIKPKIDNENYKTTVDILSKYVNGNVIEIPEIEVKVEEISPEEIIDPIEESMVDNVVDIKEDEEIKIESIVDSKSVKKKRGRPKRST